MNLVIAAFLSSCLWNLFKHAMSETNNSRWEKYTFYIFFQKIFSCLFYSQIDRKFITSLLIQIITGVFKRLLCIFSSSVQLMRSFEMVHFIMNWFYVHVHLFENKNASSHASTDQRCFQFSIRFHGLNLNDNIAFICSNQKYRSKNKVNCLKWKELKNFKIMFLFIFLFSNCKNNLLERMYRIFFDSYVSSLSNRF